MVDDDETPESTVSRTGGNNSSVSRKRRNVIQTKPLLNGSSPFVLLRQENLLVQKDKEQRARDTVEKFKLLNTSKLQNIAISMGINILRRTRATSPGVSSGESNSATRASSRAGSVDNVAARGSDSCSSDNHPELDEYCYNGDEDFQFHWNLAEPETWSPKLLEVITQISKPQCVGVLPTRTRKFQLDSEKSENWNELIFVNSVITLLLSVRIQKDITAKDWPTFGGWYIC